MNTIFGAVTATKLAASPLQDNVQYLRFMVDPRLAEGKRAEFNANFADENVSYGISLRNGIVAVTEAPNSGPSFDLSKDDWSQLILGERTFASLSDDLAAFDTAISRN